MIPETCWNPVIQRVISPLKTDASPIITNMNGDCVFDIMAGRPSFGDLAGCLTEG